MIRTATLHSIYIKVALLCVLAIGLFVMVNPGYLIMDVFMWVCVVTLPVTFRVLSNVKSHRFFWPALMVILISLALKSTFGVYCSMIFFILLVIEMYVGKLSFLTLFHLLLLSPLFKYFSSLISFPLRMQISKIVAGMFQFAGMDIELSGNLIIFNGTEFLVDKACMGLHMLGYSFLFGLIILSRMEKEGQKLSLWSISSFMLLLLALNFISNICRASILIMFKVMPESWLHDALGLLIFILYVLLPFYWITKWWYKRKRERQSNETVKRYRLTNVKFSVVITLFMLSLWQNRQGEVQNQPHAVIHLDGFSQTVLDNDVVKLNNDEALIYIKPPVAPYKADHNPLICWQGSGYSFKKIDYKSIGEHQVYFAELVKGNDKLYSAWWFQSDHTVVSDQWKWRWNSLTKNHRYSMINITCASIKDLEINCSSFLENTNQIKPILTSN